MKRILPTFLLLVATAVGAFTNIQAYATSKPAPTPGPNLDLATLSASSGTISPAFDPSVTSYMLYVAFEVENLSVMFSAADPDAVLQVIRNSNIPDGVNSPADEPIDLNVGDNTFEIQVSDAENTNSKSYTITIVRAPSPNAKLAAIDIPDQNYIPMEAGLLAYETTVPNATESVWITPLLEDKDGSVRVWTDDEHSYTVADNEPAGPFYLLPGENTIQLDVTAPDGNTTESYTLTVKRDYSDNASLAALGTSAGTLAPGFDPGTTNYQVTVSNANETFSVTPTAVEAGSLIHVRINDGEPEQVESGYTSSDLPLHLEDNTIEIIVTAPDKVSTQPYTITVYREMSAIADLEHLTVSAGTLSPDFDPSVTTYSVSVPHSVETLDITPTAATASRIDVVVNDGPYANISSGSPAPAALNVGDNTIYIEVTAQDGNGSKKYTISAYREGSSNAKLDVLGLSEGTLSPSFDPDHKAYTATVDNSVKQVYALAVPQIRAGKVEVKFKDGSYEATDDNGTSADFDLTVGENLIELKVIAEDGTTEAYYSITVTREPSDNPHLSGITLSTGSILPDFHPLYTEYTASVPNETEHITVTPTTEYPAATVELKLNDDGFFPVTSGEASVDLDLQFGENRIELLVTAENGILTKSYTILVTRTLSDNALLSGITVSEGSISPDFEPNRTEYQLNVANALESITVSPTAEHAHAKIELRINEGDWATVASGESSAYLALNEGNNTLDIQVTAQDGTVLTYTVAVERAYNDNANLSALAVSAGTLSPAFDAATTAYAISIDPANASFSVTPTAEDPTAMIEVSVNGQSPERVESGSASTPVLLNQLTNDIQLKVTADDWVTVKNYQITATVNTDVANLSALSIGSGTLSPSFSASATAYSASVRYSVSSLTINFGTVSPTASVDIKNGDGSWTTLPAGAVKTTVALGVGENEISIRVTGDAGGALRTARTMAVYEKVYILTVNRADPLPVTLVSFSGKRTAPAESELRWVTADEVDFDRFELERSTDGKIFEKIGVISGRRGEKQLNSYLFTDLHVPVAAYYRLKMVDTDLSFAYSRIIALETGEIPAIAGEVYPNPITAGTAHLDLISDKPGLWKITATDLSGYVRPLKEYTLPAGQHKLAIDFSGLRQGTYLIRIANGDEALTRKVVVF